MDRLRRLAACAAGCLALALPATAQAALPNAGPPPSSMASIGDSITRAFNACGYYYDCVSRSWSTGSSSTVNSHYRRILARNPAINGRNYNCGETGADMADFATQVNCAVSRNVQYVTILLGANDACSSSEASMTPTATYRSQFESGMATLTSALPNARIAVASVPNVYRLWEVLHHDGYALAAWDGADICQSMLANAYSHSTGDESRRQRVRQRIVEYNTVLADVCSRYAYCDFDSNAVFNYPFQPSQVSDWDYFHPNTAGQNVLASQTYAAGFGW